jgi:hypothetical protein
MNTATSADMGKGRVTRSTMSGTPVIDSGHCHHCQGLAEATP